MIRAIRLSNHPQNGRVLKYEYNIAYLCFTIALYKKCVRTFCVVLVSSFVNARVIAALQIRIVDRTQSFLRRSRSDNILSFNSSFRTLEL